MSHILITSAGRRVSLTRFFKKELKKIFPDGKVFATDADPLLSAACREADEAIKVKRSYEEGFIQELLELSVQRGIKIIIPTIDTELKVLSENKELFSKNGIQIIVSDSFLINIFRDKRETANFFKKHGIDAPTIYNKEELQFPAFIKPYDGSMSIDTFYVPTLNDLKPQHLNNPKFMYMEYIDHSQYAEYTVDMYYDKSNNLRCLVPRKRIEVRGGEINKGITCKNYIYSYLKEKLAKIEGAVGCYTLQLFYRKEDNSIKAIEINPRFGGGYPLSYHAGANYPLNIIKEYLLNEEIETLESWEDGLLMLRYDHEILVHA